MVGDTTTTFGALLRRHRLAAGLTQEALAERAGLSVYGIQKLERGTTHPYRDTAARLASVLELSADDADRFWAAVEPWRRRGSVRSATPRSGPHHNLPIGVTSFVGREEELESIPSRLQSAHLLTLTGAGGSGKTRLAIEVARRLVEDYRDGVWLVELAQLADPTLVPHRVAAMLGIQEIASRPLAQALADSLRDSELLLVMDNCEHLLESCAALLDLLMRHCPMLQILATSREPIGIPGEVICGVSPLASPSDLSESVVEIERWPAVRLFADRASDVQPSFVLAENNANTIAQICRRLDGIPLALELAAARLDALTPGELANRLDHSFGLLTGGNRAALPRQQTLSATIDWSYVLLSEPQRRIFERLSVFANGWTLDAAEAVCHGDGIAAADVLEAVLQLVRKTLVVRMDGSQGTARYGLLETLRQYAWDKLEHRGDELATTRERHAAYYSALVARLDPAGGTTLLPFSGQAVTTHVFEILDDAQDNVQVALRWYLEARHAAEGLELTRALGPLWFFHGYPVDCRRWVEAMLELAASPGLSATVRPAQYAQALMFASQIAQLQGDNAGAHRLIEASVALWRTLDDPLGLAWALTNSSSDHLIRGDFDRGEALAREAVALAKTVAEPFTLSSVLASLGLALIVHGQPEQAASHIREGIAVGQTVERVSLREFVLTRALAWLGRAESERGAGDAAIQVFKDALAQLRHLRVTGYLFGFCLAWMADAIAHIGEPERAARLFGAAEAQIRRAGVTTNPTMKLSPRDGLRRAQAQLGPDAYTRAWNEGHAMDVAQVFAYALDEPA